MNKLLKAVGLSCFLMTSGCLFALPAFAASSAEATSDGDVLPVKVQLNDTLLSPSEGKPFIDSEQNLQVPIRLVAESFGYKLTYAPLGDQAVIVLQRDKDLIVVQTGKEEAIRNNKPIKMPSAAHFVDSVAYVPLRFVSETQGVNVQWDADNGIAIIDEDGKYHAPAWYKPQVAQNQIVQTAEQYNGVRYVWGGSTPNGFDCSGFVNYVFDKQGIDLPRTSQGMYDSAGSPTEDPQPGDLVFFARGHSIFHVGIYVGDDQFISATSHGVRVEGIGDKYWSPYYVGAKRVM